jgi:hypothetical protein
MADVSAEYLADVEAGNTHLSEAQLARAAAALNLIVDDLTWRSKLRMAISCQNRVDMIRLNQSRLLSHA